MKNDFYLYSNVFTLYMIFEVLLEMAIPIMAILSKILEIIYRVNS